MGLKIGANKTDQKYIRELTKQGYKPEEISARLLISVQTIKNFTPEKQAKGQAKVKEINEKAIKEHVETMKKKRG